MSTIKADNWQPSAGGTSVDIGGGLSKTWCHLNGTGTIAIQDSLGISSVVDGGTGHYGFNFTSEFTSASYNGVGSCGTVATGAACQPDNGSLAVGSMYFDTFNSGTGLTDNNIVMMNLHGSLA